MEVNLLAYFSLCETLTSDSYVGANLITNHEGFPIEFKCTHALKPSLIQRALYGDQLQPYLAVNLCAKPLYNLLTSKPIIVFVNQPYVLSLRKEIQLPVIYLRKSGANDKPQNELQNTNTQLFIKNKKNPLLSIILEAHPDFEDDIKSNTTYINDLINKFDLFEPFERITKSVQIMGKNDNKYK